MLQRLRKDISAEEYAALLEVKGRVAEGKIRIHMASCDECIGAHMARVMGLDPFSYVMGGSTRPLRFLFFPSYSLLFSVVIGSKYRPTPRWLVLRAIDRFLVGKIPWRVK